MPKANLREAVRLRPNHADAYNHLGVVLRQAGNLDEAIKSFQHALQLRPDFADAQKKLRKSSLKGAEKRTAAGPHTGGPAPVVGEGAKPSGIAAAQQGKLDEA